MGRVVKGIGGVFAEVFRNIAVWVLTLIIKYLMILGIMFLIIRSVTK